MSKALFSNIYRLWELEHGYLWGFPGSSVVKNPPVNEVDTGAMGSVPRSGRFPGGRNGHLLQYSCLENSMGRGAWRAAGQEVAKSWTWLSYWACMHGHTRGYLCGVVSHLSAHYTLFQNCVKFSSHLVMETSLALVDKWESWNLERINTWPRCPDAFQSWDSPWSSCHLDALLVGSAWCLVSYRALSLLTQK